MGKKITITGAEAVVRMVGAHGVKIVFGMCGHTVIGVLDAMSRSDVRFISVHHEGVAAHAADGMARRTGRAGVVLVHLGPGMTNAITGIANAMQDAIPMVVISGNIQSYYFGRNAHQETNLHADANQADSLIPFTKRVWKVVKPESLVPSIEAAFRLAETGRKGPVLVDVAMDVFSLPVEFEEGWTPGPKPELPQLSRKTAREILSMVKSARKPVLYLGPGAASDDGARAASSLAEKLNIPVAYELLGKGILPDDHPLNLGVTGFGARRPPMPPARKLTSSWPSARNSRSSTRVPGRRAWCSRSRRPSSSTSSAIPMRSAGPIARRSAASPTARRR